MKAPYHCPIRIRDFPLPCIRPVLNLKPQLATQSKLIFCCVGDGGGGGRGGGRSEATGIDVEDLQRAGESAIFKVTSGSTC